MQALQIPVWLIALFGAWLVVGFGVYFDLLARAARGQAKVSVREFNLPDLLVLSVFFVWFSSAIAHGFSSRPREVAFPELIVGALVFVAIVLVIGIFLQWRGFKLRRQFGFDRRSPWLCLPLALGLLLAAYPLVGSAALISQWLLHGAAQEQPLIQFFREAALRGDRGEILATMLVAVLVAPAVEEIIFRGYFYGVMKRYCGGAIAALAASAFFAAMHVNAASLAPLFTLALCLTLAYEITGSLLVNIFMHAMFNLFTLLAVLGAAHYLHLP